MSDNDTYTPYYWNPEAAAPAALTAVARFNVVTPHSRPQLVNNLPRSANAFWLGHPDRYEWITRRFLHRSVGTQVLDWPPATPISMLVLSLQDPDAADPLHHEMRQMFDPIARRAFDRDRVTYLACHHQVYADAVVSGMYHAGFQPATFCEMMALVIHHQLDPQPGLPGWDDESSPTIYLHALGSCEKVEHDGDMAGTTISFSHPVIQIEREPTIGRPFSYYLSTASGEYDNRGLVAFGRDFFLAVQTPHHRGPVVPF